MHTQNAGNSLSAVFLIFIGCTHIQNYIIYKIIKKNYDFENKKSLNSQDKQHEKVSKIHSRESLT